MTTETSVISIVLSLKKGQVLKAHTVLSFIARHDVSFEEIFEMICFSFFQTETRVDINCKNADGLTPLLLVTRDVQLFERLGDRVTRGYDPVEVMELLLNYRA